MIQLYHNPRCSKSRAALAYLTEKGQAFEVIEYLKNPPSFSELTQIYQALAIDDARQMMRVKDELFHELGLHDTTLSNDDLLRAIETHPALLERPIVLVGNRAAIGRPLENIMALF